MNRTLLQAISCALLSVTAISSTAQAFTAGDNVVGLGIGVGGHYGVFGSYTAQSPVLMATFDRGTGIKAGPGVIGIGGYFAYKSVAYRYDYYSNYYYDRRWNYIMFGVRGTYHWNAWHGIDQLDTYAGVLAGLNIIDYKDKSEYPSGYVSPTYGSATARTNLFAGARWYFTEGFGAYAELSHGVSYVTVGLNFKF
ncbi:MAG: hypothetical protein IPO17_06635 [Flavobacteriales bacterium]|nr:hypothetical protein [Flavobacteriales bacterium]MBK9194658.1 hypothetical protein [Flavobacteriales bacterium]